jgi:hypothetical protein
MDGKRCFFCDKEISTGMRYKLEAVDIPYTNLLFHRDCYRLISDISLYIQENEKKLSIYNENIKIKRKKST